MATTVPVRGPAPPQSGPAEPATTFHLFSRLPAELRLKIWGYNLPQARLVAIRCGSSSLDSAPTARSWTNGCTSTAPIPVNLHVCAESRAVALRYYRLNFGFARGPGHVFLNPWADMVYFGPRDGYMAANSQFHAFMSMCQPAELASIHRLAINDALFWIDDCYRSMTASRLTVELLREIESRMPGLQELVFVPRDDGLASDMVYARMASQIQAATDTLRTQMPLWTPLHWTILPFGALTDAHH